jgi:hypothetical protein
VRLEVRDTPKLPIPFYKGIYIGQLTLTLGHYADGWPVRKVTHTLPPPCHATVTQIGRSHASLLPLPLSFVHALLYTVRVGVSTPGVR